MTSQIAQRNTGRFFHPTEGLRVAAFVANLDRGATSALGREGFVWRIKDESINATSIRSIVDTSIAVILSVWESLVALSRISSCR
jgi:hypothetical protein